jgi:short-subunit dehydrogenase
VKLKEKVAVVTGAASGIGRELAIVLAREECLLALADINRKGLTELAESLREINVTVFAEEVDVSSEAQVFHFAEKVKEHYDRVNILINNAGLTLFGSVREGTLKDFEWVMNTNFWGVIYGTKAFLPHLMSQGEAYLVNICSGYGLIAVPDQAAYCSSKFAVRGFTEALQQELKDTSIHVMCVYPGGTRTGLPGHARLTPDKRRSRFIADSVEHYLRNQGMDPAIVACKIIQGMKKKKKRILIGSDVIKIDLISRLLPGSYSTLLTSKEKKGHW